MLRRRLSTVAIGAIVTLSFAASAQAACVPGSRGPIVPSADTYADAGTPRQNYGSALSLTAAEIQPFETASYGPFWTRQRMHAYVKYPLPAVPPGCSLSQATLRISPRFRDYVLVVSPVVGGITPRPIYIAPAASNWKESSLTWKRQPGSKGPEVKITVPGEMLTDRWTVTPAIAALYVSGNTGLEIFARDPQVWYSPNSREYRAKYGKVGIPYLFVSWS
jgi:hypothetical protein